MTLELDLNKGGGRFSTTFELKKEGSFPLPGGPGAWPMEVTDQKDPRPVLGRERPVVWLPAGRHTLTGAFHWSHLPDTLTLPLGFILNLRVDGQRLDFPALEVDYQAQAAHLWLTPKNDDQPPAETETDRLTVNVNRLIQDSQPMMIKSRFRLTVSGQPREAILKNALLPGTLATFLTSDLPTQLTAEGLRVQLKPGIFEIFLDSRALTSPETLAPPENSETPEYWAFQAQPQLRLVDISGARQIDPSQADLYPAWRHLPVYLMMPGSQLVFNAIRRGDPEPPPDSLNLSRECWLDYDGRGLSCRDHLTGTLNRQWHLNVSPPFSLGQASLAGQPQVITWQTDARGRPAPGLQLRNGQVNLRADLRLDRFNGRIPASGWDHQLETEGQRLNLPPGYHLLHVTGAEARQSSPQSGAGTWTGAWGALDFFVVLIIAIAAGKLYGRPTGCLALAALILGYHEPMAPQMVFLHLLGTAALLPLLPRPGRAHWLVAGWRFLAALTLVILTALFMINQVRVTLHPQLENPAYWSDDGRFTFLGGGISPGAANYYPQDNFMTESAADFDEMAEAPAPSSAPASSSLASGHKSAESYANRMVKLSRPLDAKVQNSLPRPDWRWRSVRLYYNTSVTAEQEVRLYLIGPTAGRWLGAGRLIFMAWFTLVMLTGAGRLTPLLRPGAPAAAVILILSLLLGQLATPALAQEKAFPDEKLLESYRERLLAPRPVPEPSISELRLTAEPDRLTFVLTVNAARETVISLPTLDREIFQPERLAIADRDLPLVDDHGRWLTLIPAGRHQLTLAGRLKTVPTRPGFQINFSPEAKPERTIISEKSSWQVEGLPEDGRLVGEALYLSAPGGAEPAGQSELEESTRVNLAPFFLVKRTLSLGLEWQVHTTVQRLTPTGSPVTLKLPLLPGENPLTGDWPVDDGRLTLNFAPRQDEISWDSSLTITPELTLTALEGPWTESWSLDASPIWRVSSRGLVPIHNTQNGFWQPNWRPWPGESLSLTVDKPEPVPGQYLVIDQGRLAVTAAGNNQINDLDFRVRTSQGGPYSFSLPQTTEVRSFKVDGQSIPLAPQTTGASAQGTGPTLTASLSAGEHLLEVSWNHDQPWQLVTATPALNLGANTANLSLSLTMPENRWILWAWGPLQGPVVQFWSLLAVILLAAAVLSRYTATPLGWGSWFLLGLGLMQLHLFGAMFVAGWILLLARRRRQAPVGIFRFNCWQVFLALWTLAALTLIYQGLENGLLANPDMLIEGGGSYGQRLLWFTDRTPGSWPTGQVLSVSVWFYKALMLAWALWLAVSMIKWLKWGWESLAEGTLWKKRPPRFKKHTEGEQS
jgi:hypothetical protein